MGKKKTNKTPEIPKAQLDLPVSMTPDGAWVTLKEAVEQKAAALSFGQMSLDQQAKLVAERIERQPEFELSMIGPGVVDKQRAIQEVRANTAVGRTLIEIEQRMISRMLKRASEGGS